MRAYELIGNRKNIITMHDLHKLKKIRKIRHRELEKKKKFVAQMYGDTSIKIENERQELEALELEIENRISKIQNEIEKAEIDNSQRETIRKMAMRTVKKSMHGN